jgi:predicted phosphohydrolase
MGGVPSRAMPVRIVAVADTHLFHRELVVPHGDVLVHAGDLCRAGTLGELATALHWLDSLPHEHKIVVAGNHDWSFARAHERATARAALEEAGVIYLEDAQAEIAGLRVYGSPWQPELCGWAFNLPRGPELARIWAAIPEGLDLLITHGPPAGIGDRVSDTRREGCADLAARVARVRPRVHVFGHIHEDGGVWEQHGTLFANVTTAECERGATVIDIDGDGIRALLP